MSDTEKPTLRPAEDNPWYCLATLYGEQPTDRLNHELAHKNRVIWNRWGAKDLNGDQLNELARNFANRTSPRPLTLPEPTETADFSNTRFVRPVSFLNFQFRMPTDFSAAMFSGEANFAEAQFQNKVDFSSATFAGKTNFRSAHLNAAGGSDFQSATFSKDVDFQNANFVDPNFRSVTFSGTANFHAKFHGRADFLSATFSGVANFGSAEFIGEADFCSATFSEMANFRSVKFLDIVDFSEAAFSRSIPFINATFARNTIFAGARFESQVPDFRGATMHSATEWHGVTWPKPPKSKENAQRQVYACERLKQEMEQLKKHEDEQKFFRKELRARRRLLWTLPWEWLLNVIYGLSSDYGNSFMRPLFWLIGVFAAGTAIFSRAPLHCGAADADQARSQTQLCKYLRLPAGQARNHDARNDRVPVGHDPGR